MFFFNDLPPSQVPGGFAMYFGELIEDNGLFILKEPAKFLNYSCAIRIEKNWSPFVSEGRLFLIYSDKPRVILEVDLHSGFCREISRTMPNWNWNWGTIRGGTPACLVNDQFLTFFHSSFPSKGAVGALNYVMGAYTFEKNPPFSIRSTTQVPLGKLSDYNESNSSKVVFPAGIVAEGDLIFIAWGKDDKQIFVTTFDKNKLLSSMAPLLN